MMGRVKDTVKDMLSPSWLVDLVHSVKKKPHVAESRGAGGRDASPLQNTGAAVSISTPLKTVVQSQIGILLSGVGSIFTTNRRFGRTNR